MTKKSQPRRAKRHQIVSENRFDPRSAEDLAPRAVEFGAAMAAYFDRWQCKGRWTCGQVLDVLADLGYTHPNRNFEACVHVFTLAIEDMKRGRRLRRKGKTVRVPNRFPTWSEVLAVALECGWTRPSR